MSRARRILLGFAAGGFVGYTWSHVSDGTLVPNLTRVLVLIVAFVAIASLIGLFTKVIYRTIRISNSWAWAIASIALGIATFIAVTFAIDWGVGTAIRQRVNWSFLPEGNLFEAGGIAGWTYLVLLILLGVTLLWPRLISKPNRVGAPKSQKGSKDNILSDEADVVEFLTAK